MRVVLAQPAFFLCAVNGFRMDEKRNNPVIGSLELCYVCTSKFSVDLICELHHIVPKSLGGTDGPLVPLCEKDHKLTHTFARFLVRKHNSRSDLAVPTDLLESLRALDSDGYNRIHRLASVIVTSTIKFIGDQDRLLSAQFSYKPELAAKMDKLKTKLGCTSRQDIFVRAVEELYQRHFPLG